MDHRDIEKMFFPESVVICGVSDSSANLGKEIVKNLKRFAFPGGFTGSGEKPWRSRAKGSMRI